MDEIIYLNGSLVPREGAKISPFDRGFLYGYGLFETMRSYGGRLFRLDRHLARLMGGAEKLGFAAALDPTELVQALYKTIEANKLSDARIRLTVSAGEGERRLALPSGGTLTIIIVAEELVPPPSQFYRKCLCAVLVSPMRNSLSPLSRIKSTNFLDNLIAHSEAVALGADEAILLNERGFVCECSTSNIFLVMGGKLITPSVESGILPGITREAVLELANALGIEVVEREVRVAELLRADEAFLTNSIIEIRPITEIVDGKPIGLGKPGDVTKRLMTAYRELAERETK